MEKVDLMDGIKFTEQLVLLGFLNDKEFKTIVKRIEKGIRIHSVKNHLGVLDKLSETLKEQ